MSIRQLASMDALDRLNRLGCWDYRILTFDGSRLIVAGSTDFSYYHLVEAEFAEVSFISCPTDFSHATFRHGTAAERAEVRQLVAIDAGQHLFAIDAESTGSQESKVFFILAQSLKLNEGTVFYYKRKDLKPGERIAAWVQQDR